MKGEENGNCYLGDGVKGIFPTMEYEMDKKMETCYWRLQSQKYCTFLSLFHFLFRLIPPHTAIYRLGGPPTP